MTNNKAAKPCQVCSSTAFDTLYSVTDTNQFVPGEWSIERCTICGLGRLEPFPSPDQVAGFYEDVFYDDSGQRFRPFVEKLRLWFAGLRGRTLNRLLPNKGLLMDFGAGAGNFANAMEAQGWHVTSVDPYSAAAKDSEIVSEKDGRLSLYAEPESYNAVTLWYVIEHLWDPKTAIEQMHKILKPGGVLVLAQQDFESVQAKVFKSNWLFLDPPRHLFQFSVANLEALAHSVGFETITVGRASLEMGPFTILQSMLNMLTGNGNYLFRFLRSRSLSSSTDTISKSKNAALTVLSITLLPILGPLALITYLVLLFFQSGDVFILYLRKRDDSAKP